MPERIYYPTVETSPAVSGLFSLSHVHTLTCEQKEKESNLMVQISDDQTTCVHTQSQFNWPDASREAMFISVQAFLSGFFSSC